LSSDEAEDAKRFAASLAASASSGETELPLKKVRGDLARHHQNLQNREGHFAVDLGLPKEKVREGVME
jgi:hypothetical protein